MRKFRKFAIWLYNVTGIYVISMEAATELGNGNCKRVVEILAERNKVWPNDPLLMELQNLCLRSLEATKKSDYLHLNKVFEQGLEAQRNGSHGNA